MKKWTTDPYAEEVMKKYGLSWEVAEVPLAKIDWDESRKNHARLGQGISREHVDDLLAAIRHGDVLPMPVLLNGGKHYVIFAGNHRLPAAKDAGETMTRAYVIASDDEKVLKTLPSALNAPMRVQERDERIKLAARAVQDGLTVDEAAHVFSLSNNTIRAETRTDEIRAVLEQMGVKHASLPKTSVLELAKIQNPNVLAPAARLAVEARLTGPEVIQLSKDVRRAKTESQQIAAVANQEQALGVTASHQAIRTSRQAKRIPATGIRMAMTTIEKYLSMRTINQWGITDKHDKEQFIDRGLKFCNRLSAILKRSH